MGKRFGDRKDGIRLTNISSMHTIMPLMYPNRCCNEVFISERIHLRAVNAYLQKRTQTTRNAPTTCFSSW